MNPSKILATCLSLMAAAVVCAEPFVSVPLLSQVSGAASVVFVRGWALALIAVVAVVAINRVRRT